MKLLFFKLTLLALSAVSSVYAAQDKKSFVLRGSSASVSSCDIAIALSLNLARERVFVSFLPDSIRAIVFLTAHL